MKMLQPCFIALADLTQQVDPFLLLDTVGRLDVQRSFLADNLKQKLFVSETENVDKTYPKEIEQGTDVDKEGTP